MAKFFNLLANALFPIRSLLLVVCVFSAASIFYLLVFSNVTFQERCLLPSLLTFLWGLILFVLCHSFSGRSSSYQNAHNINGWFARLKYKLATFFLWLYSVAFIVLIIVSFHFSFKVLGI
jgi:hypothetical protein